MEKYKKGDWTSISAYVNQQMAPLNVFKSPIEYKRIWSQVNREVTKLKTSDSKWTPQEVCI